MKSLENLMTLKSQTIKKCLAMIAAASLVSVAVFAEAADAEKTTDAALHHKHHGDMDGKRGDHMKQGMDKGRHFWGAKLDLTDAQKESLKATREANKSNMNDVHEKLRTAHEALDKAITTNADDAMLNKLSTDLASAIAQKELAQAKARRDFLNLLTPEQKQKLAAYEAEHKNVPHWKNKSESKDKTEPKAQ